MMTLRRFAVNPPDVPMATTWYLTALAEGRGKQELFTRQSPQRLRELREHAMIESAVPSNRIEGVEVEPARANTIVLGKPDLRDRSEEEVAGYRHALRLIHESANEILVTEATIRQLHRLSRGDVWDAGEYKERDVDIIETYPDGRSRVRFRTVPAGETSYVNYSLYILKTAYKEFEEGVGKVRAPRGEKTALVDQAIARASETFTLTDLERACPGVSRDMIRRVLRERVRQGMVECLGRGPGAKWRRKEGNTSKRG